MTLGIPFNLSASIGIILYLLLVSWGAMDNQIDDAMTSSYGVTFAATGSSITLITLANPATTTIEMAAITTLSLGLGIVYTKYLIAPLAAKANPLPVQLMDKAINSVFPSEA